MEKNAVEVSNDIDANCIYCWLYDQHINLPAVEI